MRKNILVLIALTITVNFIHAGQVKRHKNWKSALASLTEKTSELTIVKDRKTAYEILLPKKSSKSGKTAANELQRYLAVMTTVKFKITTTAVAGAKYISLGNTELFKKNFPQFNYHELSHDGYFIGVEKDNIFIAGGSLNGVINGVFALLEEDLNCRWYERGEYSIPYCPSLKTKISRRSYVPQLKIRDPFYWNAFHKYWAMANKTNSPDSGLFRGLLPSWRYAKGFTCHTFSKLVPASKYFKTNSEYFALVKGRRRLSQLCLSNKEVQRLALKRALEALRADPGAKLISISQNDADNYCQCAGCRAINKKYGNTNAGSLIAFVNIIAEGISREFPDVTVTTLAYKGTVKAPVNIKPRANVMIRLCTDRHAFKHFFEPFSKDSEFGKALEDWHGIGAKIFIWDYVANFHHYVLVTPNLPLVTKNIDYLLKRNVHGIMLQGDYQAPGAANATLKCWVWAKLLWNPKLDTKELLKDFVYGYYGEAAEPVLKYNLLLWDMWEKNHAGSMRNKTFVYSPNENFLSKEFIIEATKLFSQAEKMTNNPVLLRRISVAKLPLIYLKLSRGINYLENEDYFALADEFEKICKREKVTRLWEDGSSINHVQNRLDFWREKARAVNDVFDAVRIGIKAKFTTDENMKGDESGFYKEDYSAEKWKTIKCGEEGGWNKQGYDSYTGVGWYQVKFNALSKRKNLRLHLFFGGVDEEAIVYLNGVKVFEHTVASTGLDYKFIWNKPFVFALPGNLVKKNNVLTIRVFNKALMGGIHKPVYLIESSKAKLNADLVKYMLKEQGSSSGKTKGFSIRKVLVGNSDITKMFISELNKKGKFTFNNQSVQNAGKTDKLSVIYQALGKNYCRTLKYGKSIHMNELKPSPVSFENNNIINSMIVTKFGTLKLVKGEIEIFRRKGENSKSSLRLSGGKNITELIFDKPANISLKLMFSGERWTSKAPFELTVEEFRANKWHKLANYRNWRTGKFIRKAVMVSPGTSKIRFTNIAPDRAGILLDNILLESLSDNVPVSFENTQSDNNALNTTLGCFKSEQGKLKILSTKGYKSKCSLQLTGGENSTILFLHEPLQQDGILSFYAERWTGKAPFEFSVELYKAGKYENIPLKSKARTGRFTKFELPVPQGVKQIRFKCEAPPEAGILLDNIRID